MRPAPARGGGRRRREASPASLDALEQQVAELESALEDVEWASALVDFENQASPEALGTGKAARAARQPLKTHAGAARVLAREISDELQAWREEQEQLHLRAGREFAASRAEALQLAVSGAIWPRACDDEAAPGSKGDPVREAVMKHLFSQASEVLRRHLQEASDRPSVEAAHAVAGAGPAAPARLGAQLQEACCELRSTAPRAPPAMLRAIESLGGAVERKADRMRGMRARFRQDKAPVDPEATRRVKASAARRQEVLGQEVSRRLELLQLIRRAKQDEHELSEQLAALARGGPADRGQLQWSVLWPNETETYVLSARGAGSPFADGAPAPAAARLEALSPPAERGERRLGGFGAAVAALAAPSPGAAPASPPRSPRPAAGASSLWSRGAAALAGAEADLEEVSRELERKAEVFSEKLCEDFRGMCEDSDQRRKGAESELDAWKLDATLETLEDLRSSLADSSAALASRLRASIHPAARQPPKERLLRARAAAEGFQNFGDENLAEEIAAARTLLAELRAGTGERRRLAAERVETACEKRFGDLREQMLEQAQRAEAGAARCVGAAALELLSKCAGALPLPRPPASGRDATPPGRASYSADGSEEFPHELLATAERALGDMPPSAEACAVLQGLLALAEDELRATRDRLARMEEGAPLDPEEPVEPEQPVPPGPAARVASGKVASQWRRKPAN